MGARYDELLNRRKFRRKRIVPSRTRGCRVCFLSGQVSPTSSANVRGCLGMDSQRLLALSRLSRGAWRARRIQREIYVQPIRLTRWLVRNLADSHSPDVSQFL